MQEKMSQNEIINQVKLFDEEMKSLILSTSDSNGDPLTSFSPFVKLHEDYFICISSNLPHFNNIVLREKAHVMLIEDESKASNIYARKRLYFQTICSVVDNSEKIFSLFDTRYEGSLSFLRQMPDFKTIKLTPLEKNLVLGFGSAYIISKDGQLLNKNIQHK